MNPTNANTLAQAKPIKPKDKVMIEENDFDNSGVLSDIAKVISDNGHSNNSQADKNDSSSLEMIDEIILPSN